MFLFLSAVLRQIANHFWQTESGSQRGEGRIRAANGLATVILTWPRANVSMRFDAFLRRRMKVVANTTSEAGGDCSAKCALTHTARTYRGRSSVRCSTRNRFREPTSSASTGTEEDEVAISRGRDAPSGPMRFLSNMHLSDCLNYRCSVCCVMIRQALAKVRWIINHILLI